MILALIAIWLSGAAFGMGTALVIVTKPSDERHQPPWDHKGEVEEAP